MLIRERFVAIKHGKTHTNGLKLQKKRSQSSSNGYAYWDLRIDHVTSELLNCFVVEGEA